MSDIYNNTRKNKRSLIFRRVILSIPFLSFLFIIFIIFAISTVRLYFQSSRIYESRLKKEAELAKEQEKNTESNKDLLEIQTEEGKEKVLRQKFQIKKPGEEMVVIMNPKDDGAQNKNSGGNFITKFFRALFKRD